MRKAKKSESAAEEANDVIGGDDTDQHSFVIHYGQGEQVVFVEQLCNFIFLGFLMAGDERLGHQGE
jgi:hypothetical protein